MWTTEVDVAVAQSDERGRPKAEDEGSNPSRSAEGPSSNGKTPVLQTGYEGSIPSAVHWQALR